MVYFQEDILQVVIISGWWMSANKLSLAFSLYVLFYYSVVTFLWVQSVTELFVYAVSSIMFLKALR